MDHGATSRGQQRPVFLFCRHLCDGPQHGSRRPSGPEGWSAGAALFETSDSKCLRGRRSSRVLNGLFKPIFPPAALHGPRWGGGGGLSLHPQQEFLSQKAVRRAPGPLPPRRRSLPPFPPLGLVPAFPVLGLSRCRGACTEQRGANKLSLQSGKTGKEREPPSMHLKHFKLSHSRCPLDCPPHRDIKGSSDRRIGFLRKAVLSLRVRQKLLVWE